MVPMFRCGLLRSKTDEKARTACVLETHDLGARRRALHAAIRAKDMLVLLNVSKGAPSGSVARIHTLGRWTICKACGAAALEIVLKQ
jgi:hypothetical protein